MRPAEALRALRAIDSAERARLTEVGNREALAETARASLRAQYPVLFFDRLARAVSLWRHGVHGAEVRSRGLLFDNWYRHEYRKHRIGFDPLSHLLRIGIIHDLAPNPFFDPGWYRRTHRLNDNDIPLLHYLRHGAAQALAPGPLFDAVGYLRSYPDLAMEPDLLSHYIRVGASEGRNAPVVRWSVA